MQKDAHAPWFDRASNLGCMRHQRSGRSRPAPIESSRAFVRGPTMSFAFIREGDTTSHGGVVLSSGAITFIDGRPIAFVGTMVTCPKCKGVFPIVTSKNPGMNFDGRQAAFQGDMTACGATLMASQGNAVANMPVGAGGTTISARHEADGSAERYRGRFQIVAANGQPAANSPYSLRAPEGQTISGTTDADGYTPWRHADSPASLILGREKPE